MRVLYLLICVGLITCPVLGCGGEGGSEGASGGGTPGQQSGGSATEVAQEAAGDAADQVTVAVQQYKTEALNKLAQYEEGLHSLQETVKVIDNKEIDAQIGGIQEKLEKARDAVNDLEVGELADLNTHKNQLDSQLDDLKKELDQAQETISGLKDKTPKIPG